jgi:hypothetical protein
MFSAKAVFFAVMYFQVPSLQDVPAIISSRACGERPVALFDIDYTLTAPRLEKGDTLRHRSQEIVRQEFGRLLGVPAGDMLVTRVLGGLLKACPPNPEVTTLINRLHTDQETLENALLENLSFAFVSHCDQFLIEPTAPTVLQDIQQSGVPCYGFTALSAATLGDQSLAQWRLQWLETLGLHFSPYPPEGTQLELSQRFLKGVAFQKGVIFAGGEDRGSGKGAVLRDLLERGVFFPGGAAPTMIFMIDDRDRNFPPLQEAADAFGVPLVPLLYEGSAEFYSQYKEFLTSVLAQFTEEIRQACCEGA